MALAVEEIGGLGLGLALWEEQKDEKTQVWVVPTEEAESIRRSGQRAPWPGRGDRWAEQGLESRCLGVKIPASLEFSQESVP